MPLDPNTVPVVEAVTPNEGTQGGGTSVTITGTGFTGATGVYFGYNPNNTGSIVSVAFTVVSDTSITCTTPVSPLVGTGNGLVDVIVQNANGFSLPSEVATFEYLYLGEFTQATITHTFLNADDSVATGKLTFTLDDQMTNGTSTVMPTRFEVTLNGSGAFSQLLYSNVDPGTTPPPPWQTRWRVDFHITGASQRTYWIEIPTGGGTIDLFTLIPSYPQVG